MSDHDSQNFAEKNAAREFPVWQSHLLAKTGLPVKEFRRLRDEHCTQNVDWRVGKLNHISFTSAAAEKMLRLAMPEKTPPPAPSLAAQRTPDVPRTMPALQEQLTRGAVVLAQTDVEMTVVKVWPNNRGRLQARVLADGRHKKGELVVVRVRDNQRFRTGRSITGRHVEGNVYQVSGKGLK